MPEKQTQTRQTAKEGMQWHAAPLVCLVPQTQCLKSKLKLGKLPAEGKQ